MFDKGKVFWVRDNDVVEVVRCKNCQMFCPEEIRKLYNTDKYCMRTGLMAKDDDFCSRGERRTDG